MKKAEMGDIMFKRLKQIGPGALVAAAFIGPGTVTTCMLAGSGYGYALLWALLLATVITMTLQDMAARLGIVTGKGLGTVLRESLEGSPWRWPLYAIIITALYLGNAAYEAGNISGAALGIKAIFGEGEGLFRVAVLMISALAAGLLWTGRYKLIERVLIGLVLLMAVSFAITFLVVRPDLTAMGRGLVVPRIPGGSLMLVIALIGTTVVPYNLFLHAGSVKDRWPAARGSDAARSAALKSARTDSVLSIGLGGLITIMIAATSAAFVLGSGEVVQSAADMAAQFAPVYGASANYVLGAGLLAAGLSSAITAPLATAYAVTEILGRHESGEGAAARAKPVLFRAIALSVIVCGALVALTGIKPITIILSAQFANGLLLPIAAAFLLFAMNRRALLGRYANGVAGNIAGALIVIVMLGLGLRLVLKAFGVI